jgi:hypothetical protein
MNTNDTTTNGQPDLGIANAPGTLVHDFPHVKVRPGYLLCVRETRGDSSLILPSDKGNQTGWWLVVKIGERSAEFDAARDIQVGDRIIAKTGATTPIDGKEFLTVDPVADKVMLVLPKGTGTERSVKVAPQGTPKG